MLDDLLVASLAEDLDGASDLAAAIAAHQASAGALAADGDHRPPASAAERVSPRRTIGQPIHQPQQVQRRERLGEEQVGAGAAGPALRLLVAVAGEHHDRRVGGRGLGPQPPAGLDPVQARHVDVQEDDRRPHLAGALDRLLAVAGLRQR